MLFVNSFKIPKVERITCPYAGMRMGLLPFKNLVFNTFQFSVEQNQNKTRNTFMLIYINYVQFNQHLYKNAFEPHFKIRILVL